MDIDDGLDFTMDMGRTSRWLYSHNNMKYEKADLLQVVQRTYCFATCYSTYYLFQLLSSHEQYTILSHREQMLDGTFGLYNLHSWYNIHIYISPLYIKLLTHSSWDIQISIISSTQVWFSWQLNSSMGLNCIHHYEERDITILRPLHITIARSFTRYQPRLCPENHRSVTWYWRSSCLLKMFTRFL